MKIKSSWSDKILDILCYSLVAMFCVTIVLPFWNLISISVTPKSEMSISFQWMPASFDFGAWKMVFGSEFIWSSFKNTVVRTVLGTLVAIFLQVTHAYPLSRDDFSKRGLFQTIILITMFFSGGLIPTYLNISELGLIDTVWALVFPSAMSAFNIILLKNFYSQLPKSLTEAAIIDGANDIYILFKIVIPLSKAILATVALWTIVGHWNAWFDCLIYINDRTKYVLQIMLRELQENVAALNEGRAGVDPATAPPSDAIIAASNLFVILPIVCVYPFLQKYFVKGIMVGGVKG